MLVPISCNTSQPKTANAKIFSLSTSWWLANWRCTAAGWNVCHGPKKQWKSICDLSLLRSHGSSSSKKSTLDRVIYWNGITFMRAGGWRLKPPPPLSLHGSPSSRQTHNNDMLTFEFARARVCVFVWPFVLLPTRSAHSLLHRRVNTCDAMNVQTVYRKQLEYILLHVGRDVCSNWCAQKTWKITRNGFSIAAQKQSRSTADNETK